MMKVGTLITLLQACNYDDIVILAKDTEGNGFSPLWKITTEDMYEAETTWSGQVKVRELTPELEKQGWTQEDVGDPEAVNCVTIWPVN